VETVLYGLNVSLQVNFPAASSLTMKGKSCWPRGYENEGIFRKNVNSEGSKDVCSYTLFALSYRLPKIGLQMVLVISYPYLI
jgi:hypothetical protein